jgi:hypothetical protein
LLRGSSDERVKVANRLGDFAAPSGEAERRTQRPPQITTMPGAVLSRVDMLWRGSGQFGNDLYFVAVG